MLVRRLIVLGLAIISLTAAAQPALAQQPTAPPPTPADEPTDPKYTLTAGYQYLYDSSWKEHLKFGFMASLSRRISPTMAIVGEAGGSHGEYGTTGFTIQRYAFLGGLRLLAGEGEVRPFFQVLAGYSRQGGDVGIANGLAIQPGGGADLTVNEWLLVRAQGDYRFVREDGQNYNMYRITAGVVWSFGK